eukprot:1159567-Pelagomonas_calceolata.AAC.4
MHGAPACSHLDSYTNTSSYRWPPPAAPPAPGYLPAPAQLLPCGARRGACRGCPNPTATGGTGCESVVSVKQRTQTGQLGWAAPWQEEQRPV